MIRIEKLKTGYHIYGPGIGNRCYPKRWPCPAQELEAAFEESADERFRQEVRDVNNLEREGN